jgi:hypothetical protein
MEVRGLASRSPKALPYAIRHEGWIGGLGPFRHPRLHPRLHFPDSSELRVEDLASIRAPSVI